MTLPSAHTRARATQLLCRALVRNLTLRSLCVANNSLGARAGETLATTVLASDSLTHLDVSRNKLLLATATATATAAAAAGQHDDDDDGDGDDAGRVGGGAGAGGSGIGMGMGISMFSSAAPAQAHAYAYIQATPAIGPPAAAQASPSSTAASNNPDPRGLLAMLNALVVSKLV